MLNTYMRKQNFPPELRRQIEEFYHIEHKLNNSYVDEVEILRELPSRLKRQLSLEISKRILKNVPLFDGLDAPFIRAVGLSMERKIFPQAEYIIRQGTPVDQLYIVTAGRACIFNDNVIRGYLNSGDYFGRVPIHWDMPFEGGKSNYSVRTIEWTEVRCLSMQRFRQLVSEFPEIKAKLIDKIVQNVTKGDHDENGEDQFEEDTADVAAKREIKKKVERVLSFTVRNSGVSVGSQLTSLHIFQEGLTGNGVLVDPNSNDTSTDIDSFDPGDKDTFTAIESKDTNENTFLDRMSVMSTQNSKANNSMSTNAFKQKVGSNSNSACEKLLSMMTVQSQHNDYFTTFLKLLKLSLNEFDAILAMISVIFDVLDKYEKDNAAAKHNDTANENNDIEISKSKSNVVDDTTLKNENHNDENNENDNENDLDAKKLANLEKAMHQIGYYLKKLKGSQHIQNTTDTRHVIDRFIMEQMNVHYDGKSSKYDFTECINKKPYILLTGDDDFEHISAICRKCHGSDDDSGEQPYTKLSRAPSIYLHQTPMPHTMNTAQENNTGALESNRRILYFFNCTNNKHNKPMRNMHDMRRPRINESASTYFTKTIKNFQQSFECLSFNLGYSPTIITDEAKFLEAVRSEHFQLMFIDADYDNGQTILKLFKNDVVAAVHNSKLSGDHHHADEVGNTDLLTPHQRKSVILVLVTSFFTKHLQDVAKKCGIHAMLRKPIMFNDLKQMFSRMKLLVS